MNFRNYFRVLLLPILLVLPDITWASSNGILWDYMGILLWGALITSGIAIILKEPLRGTAKVISYILPFVVAFVLPLYLMKNYGIEGWSLFGVFAGCMYLAYWITDWTSKFFPEDNEE